MANLSVNINKLATLRNARGENNPNILEMALLIEDLGAHGITVHPRPDERHIRRSDVFQLKKHLRKEFNIEGYPSESFISLIKEIRPQQVTLVPDPPHVLTSNAGFTLKEDKDFVTAAIKVLKPYCGRVSIFIDPKDFLTRTTEVIESTGTDRIELYTKAYAENYQCKKTLNIYKQLANEAHAIGIGINAGHDLDLNNLKHLIGNIPVIKEVSIGHALICDALRLGMPKTISRYLEAAS